MDFFTRQDKVRAKGRLFFTIYVPTLMAAVFGIYLAVSLAFLSVSTVSYFLINVNADQPFLVEPDKSDFFAPYFLKAEDWPIKGQLEQDLPFFLPAPLYGPQPRLLSAISLSRVGGGVLAIILLTVWHRTMAIRRGGGAYLAQELGGVELEKPLAPAEKQLVNIVEEMSLASGLPQPRLFILPKEKTINAFTAGLNRQEAVIAVTQGALNHLTRDELQGVIGHEFAHILNQDCATNMLMSGWLYGLLFFTILGRGLIDFGLDIIKCDTTIAIRIKGSLYAKFVIAVLVLPPGILLLAAGTLGHLSASIIEAAFCRTREHLADAFAVQFTRHNRGLAGALKKIGGSPRGANLSSPQAVALKSFFIADPAPRRNGRWLSPHPTLKSRIKALEPDWDGNFIKTYLRPQNLKLKEDQAESQNQRLNRLVADVKVSPDSLGQKILSLPPGWAQGVVLALAATDENGSGQPSSFASLAAESLAKAQDLLAQLPELVTQSLTSPQKVGQVVLALVLSSKPEIREKQREIIESWAGAEEMAQIMAIENELNPGLALPIMRLARPALKKLARPSQEKLEQMFQVVILADGQVDLKELAAERLLAQALAPSSVRSDLLPPTVLELKTASDLIFKALGCPDPSGPAALSSSQLRETLATLSLAPEKYRRFIIEEALTLALADGQISTQEYELLCALAAALDIPIPWHPVSF